MTTRDYKPAAAKPRPSSKGSPFLTGLLIGLILGIGISLGVAIMVTGGESPFVERVTQAPQPNITGSPETAPAESAEPAAEAPKPEANRFDFYKILPGNESAVTEQEIQQQQEAQQQSAEASTENYFLQVGAFQSEQDADNMKAKLALLGLEAVVQTANVPDKGIWHRVRVGPYTELEQITKARAELAMNGFSSDLIKIHSNIPDQ
jgi:cell division protein FtsN